MKKQILNSNTHTVASAFDSLGARFQANFFNTHAEAQQEFVPGLDNARIHQANLELAGLKNALASSQQELRDAELQIETLAAANARYRKKLVLLAYRAAEARHFAYHDELTGLPNRRLLLDRLKQAMAQAERQHKQVALLLLDLDGFKNINDKYGHEAGDKLLRQVAARLATCVRTSDTVCRYGGDEFIVMLPEIDGQENAESVKEKIRTNLAAPYVIDGKIITVMSSIGFVLYEGVGKYCLDLIRDADIAMYLAKSLNKARSNTHQHQMSSKIQSVVRCDVIFVGHQSIHT
ncbi:MAG: GGDEF domain-containing protein [Burkholderiales bacterium]